MLALYTLALMHAAPASAQNRGLTACADPPSWTFWVTDEAGNKTRSPNTFSLDMLEAAAARMGLTVRFIAEPWSRCMRQVQAGEIDFGLGAYHSKERASHFAYSVPYSRATPQVFYLRSRPLRIEDAADLHRYRGCGLLGASYEHYGLQAKDLDLGVNTYDKMIAKLKIGRCDYFVEELEVVAGYKYVDNDYLANPELMHGPVPGVVAPAAHLIAGLDTPGAALMPQLDRALQELVRSGQAAKLWRRHAPDIPYRAP